MYPSFCDCLFLEERIEQSPEHTHTRYGIAPDDFEILQASFLIGCTELVRRGERLPDQLMILVGENLELIAPANSESQAEADRVSLGE
jgi:hypothetical protein